MPDLSILAIRLTPALPKQAWNTSIRRFRIARKSYSCSGEFLQWTQQMIMRMNLWTITNDTFSKFPNMLLIFIGYLSVMMLWLHVTKDGNYELSGLVEMLKEAWLYLIRIIYQCLTASGYALDDAIIGVDCSFSTASTKNGRWFAGLCRTESSELSD
ncbi:hypothetical protein ELS07_24750 [Salmonella enterica subsp. enterica serovar Lomalinda]|nr:hypothetical protein [Salmonella enterica subsp. enterica serovar Lomalinda]ECI5320798.1 hypothetical protein [Salmonella enterica subsp. enterica serovar Lomalinda]